VLYCLQDDQFRSPLCPAVTVPPATVDALKAQLAGLSEDTSQIAGAPICADRPRWRLSRRGFLLGGLGAGSRSKTWTAGGSYHVVRIIRMFVEFWDRTPLAEQEAIMGRHKELRRPAGLHRERDEPVFSPTVPTTR
jgi:deferrochelatase/peroxidase EfeB